MNTEEQFEKVLSALNQAVKDDPLAVRILLNNLVPCNEALADHPTVVVERHEEELGHTVGPLGLVNGVLAAAGLPLVASHWSDEVNCFGRRRFLGFVRYEP